MEKCGSRFMPLWLAAALLCGCSAVQPVESSGAMNAAAPLDRLAIAASPKFSVADSAHLNGDTDLASAFIPGIQRYARAFARDFSAQFPALLVARGIAVPEAAQGVPVLRIRVASYRVQCRHQNADCIVMVRLDGAVLDGTGASAWTFSDWLNPDEMDQAGFDNFLRVLMAAMVKDHVVSAGAAG